MGKMVKFAALLIGAASLQGCAIWDQINTSRAYNYLVVSHASHHVDAQREFREKNLGIGFGSEAPVWPSTRAKLGVPVCQPLVITSWSVVCRPRSLPRATTSFACVLRPV